MWRRRAAETRRELAAAVLLAAFLGACQSPTPESERAEAPRELGFRIRLPQLRLVIMDDETRRALDAIAEAVSSKPPEGPIVLSDEYLRLVEQVEQLPENRPGTDKTWTEACALVVEASPRNVPGGPTGMTSFAPLARAFSEEGVRYVLIGVAGANLHAHLAGVVFGTLDRDVFLPPDPLNLQAAWRACERCELILTSSGEPLDEPRDLHLAERVVERRGQTRASGDELQVDLTLVMAGYDFDEVWQARTTFLLDGVELPVARLRHIVTSKAAVGRDKDRLFLATHAETLRELLRPDETES